jgi:hypothetical protein
MFNEIHENFEVFDSKAKSAAGYLLPGVYIHAARQPKVR